MPVAMQTPRPPLQPLPVSEATQVLSDGVSLFVRSWGDPANTPLVLVHGYPDNHQVWRPVAEQLAARFFVIAYDVRGAGNSDAPAALSAYQLPQLGRDLAAVTAALIPGRDFHLAGHDWGSIQCWESVTTAPLAERILSYSSISGPCLDHVGYWMRARLGSRNGVERRQALRQILSSWYILFFQLPVLPPLAWRLALARLWPLYLAQREGVSEPASSGNRSRDGRHGVKLYRANFRQRVLNPSPRYAQAPVQLIVPTEDNYVGTQLFDDLSQWVPQLYRRNIEAGHWVLLTDAEKIAGWLGDFAAAVERGDHEAALSAQRVAAPAQVTAAPAATLTAG